MADITPYIPALNGLELRHDLCALIDEKLATDCNLRKVDGYAGGYRATVKIHIEAYGLDTVSMDYEVSVDEVSRGADPDNPVDIENPDTLIDTELEIPVETNLQEVRDRSNQVAGDFEVKPALEITEDGPVAAPVRQKYSRRVKALVAAQGGAAGAMEE